MSDIETYLTDEVLAFIGTEGPPSPFVSMGELACYRFAEATGDPNPLYRDREAASAAGYADIVVPPTAIGQNMRGFVRLSPPLAIKRPNGVVGSWAWEFRTGLLASERVSAREKVVGITEKRGKLGLMVFVQHEITFTKEDGTVVAVSRMTRVRY